MKIDAMPEAETILQYDSTNYIQTSQGIFLVWQKHLTIENFTSGSFYWRKSEKFFHTAYQIPRSSKSYQARNTKSKVVNFIGTKCQK